MGQGYSMTTLSAASASIDVPEMADLVYEKTLASARFMKSVRARSANGFVFVKAVMTPYAAFPVAKYVKQMHEERQALAEVPNALGYQRIIEVSSGGFLVRQYMFSSVYDRLSTRPFLEDIEKKWLTFQLLCAVRDCHARNVFHGDIKTENVLVTSWNWLFLTDFSASFKPTCLPEDNPADFSFYFDTSGRRTCYLAPERFAAVAHDDMEVNVNWAMDIFSVGCVIAEIFLEGPIFTLSQLFKYRAGEYSPEHTHLTRIEDSSVREMVLNMIDLDPEKRYSAEQYLAFYKTKLFPEYFYNFLHQYMLDLTDPLSGRRPVTLDMGNMGESDEKIDRLHFDLDKISYFLGYDKKTRTGSGNAWTAGKRQKNDRPVVDSSLYDGTLLFLNIVVASMRNTSKASARLKACDLLVEFAERLPDEAKLDRILPYLAGLLHDPSDVVKCAAIRALASMLEMVHVVSPINAYVFPEYIFPKLRQFVLSPHSRPNPLVRATYAASLASLAQSSARILDMVQAIRADGRLPTLTDDEWSADMMYHGLYDVARTELVPHFEDATKALITDPDAAVRRAFLGSVARLCVFFGSAKTGDVILSYLNTYLNDRDWILKCTFYHALVGVAAYVGSASLEKFILPLMIQSLTDAENLVVEKVFRSLARMSALGLLRRSTSWDLVDIAARFLMHPSTWIRESAVQFIVMSSRYVSDADQYCVILPILQPYLRAPVIECSETEILDNLKKPLPRPVFDVAVSWAAKPGDSVFWATAARTSDFSLPEPDTPRVPSSYGRKMPMRIPASQRSKEDDQRLDTLRTLGMTGEDEMKLLALREYIYRSAAHTPEPNAKQQLLANIVSLTDIHVTPQNVFFDSQAPARQVQRSRPHSVDRAQQGRHTIADALLDASTVAQDTTRKPISGITTEGPDGKVREVGSQPVPSIAIPSGPSPGTSSEPHPHTKDNSSVSSRSPSSVDKPLFRSNTSLALRHRSSAMHLMNRTDTAKADAAVATTSENAFGRLDGPTNTRRRTDPSPLAFPGVLQHEGHSTEGGSTPRYVPNHSYAGNDANVLRLLEHHFTENFPTDLFDFGTVRRPVARKMPIRRATDAVPPSTSATPDSVSYPSEAWRPSGQLLTIFSEHTAAINRVVAAPDDAFLVTASDDGSCKIWDTTRLEKNVTPRSRHTHRHAQGTKVKSLCFIDSTHTFVSAADDGSIHAVRVEHRSLNNGETTRYSKPILARDYRLPQDDDKAEHAVALLHYRTPTSQSILVAATNQCHIYAIDLKSPTLSIIYTLANPVQHGVPTAFAIDPKQQWLLLGTSHGVLDLWDIRFHVHLRSFAFPACHRIDALAVHPSKGHGRWVLVSSGGEVSAWDVEKVLCKEVYRTLNGSTTNTANTANTANTVGKPYDPWYPDEESTEKMLARFAQDLELDQGGRLLDPTSATTSPPARPFLPISAFAIASDYVQHKTSSGSSSEPEKKAVVLTVGADRTLRYWDTMKPDNSRIISGPLLDTSDDTGDVGRKITYDVSYPLSVSAGAQIMVVQESGPDGRGTSVKSTPTKRSRREGTRGSDSPTSTSTGGGDRAKPPRNTVISGAQQQLLRTHMHGIADAVILKKPYGLVVSVDAGGNVFVFQ